jgi:hypothetical protein
VGLQTSRFLRRGVDGHYSGGRSAIVSCVSGTADPAAATSPALRI